MKKRGGNSSGFVQPSSAVRRVTKKSLTSFFGGEVAFPSEDLRHGGSEGFIDSWTSYLVGRETEA